ncbi:MAG TPA: sulfotransferase [Streptosporangiaceae bacterium]|nr:sulfotransferase [Streptosporangiaceae bacterium]
MKTLVRNPAAWARRCTPGPVVRAGRGVYRGLATATAPLRLEPDFILIGAQRCGTTSLFRALSAHPQVVPPTVRKGVNYFDLNYYRGPHWYRRHFPLATVARGRAARHGGAVTFEASGYYMYHPFALERAAHDLPGVKLVAMLRDPVERAFSAHKHEYARGFEQEDFEKALALEDERLAGEIDRMRDDPTYESLEHRHHSYRHRGQYAEQLERALAHLPADQLHVVDSESFFEDPAQEYQRLLEFLGLRPFLPEFGRFNARPSPPMDPVVHEQLTEHYRPHDERLAALLGRPPRWAR